MLGDLDVVRIPFAPDEADAILIVNPDAMLPSSRAFQWFQTITWNRTQIVQADSPVQHQQLAPCDRMECLKGLGWKIIEDPFSIRAAEALNHNAESTTRRGARQTGRDAVGRVSPYVAPCPNMGFCISGSSATRDLGVGLPAI
jgi:hypothetical protein